ncbi:MAG: biotin--[acetyl-CoA-carboxylase] ligase [Acetobacteraceae bacterium]|nr:biotin--[acetyl-CoA-carboxylase] ligase [Acetobacteraceae bacterium]
MDQGNGAQVRERILALLRGQPGVYLPGHEICRLIGISRAALWKQMGLLRRAGYPISAKPRLGYSLKPGGAPLARTRIMGRCLLQFMRVSSTNEVARRLAGDGAVEGTVVVADEQSAGRGRQGRAWVSPRGGLWFSVVLRPPAVAQPQQLMLLGGVAVARALRRTTGLEPGLKWPNDVMLGDRKVCGILGEMVPASQNGGDGRPAVVLGVGINANLDPWSFPQEVRPLVTSLKQELGRQVSLRRLLIAVLEELEQFYSTWLEHGFGPVLEEWKALDRTVGSLVRVSTVEGSLEGRAEAVDADGRLIIDTGEGRVTAVSAGDVHLGAAGFI